MVAVGSLGIVGEAYATAWQNNHLLLAAGSANTLLVIDANDPANPSLVNTHALPELMANGVNAYAAHSNSSTCRSVSFFSAFLMYCVPSLSW